MSEKIYCPYCEETTPHETGSADIVNAVMIMAVMETVLAMITA